MQEDPSQSAENAGTSELDVVCPNCAAKYRIAANLMGRRLSCRHCREVWRASPFRAPAAVPGAAAPIREGRSSAGVPIAGENDSQVLDTNWIGRKIGRYAVVSLLGRGGMGVVWRARDDALNRDVALKILGHGDGHRSEASVALFMQEARAAAHLQHPYVVTVHEIGEDHGRKFIAMELMRGGTMRDVVTSAGPFEPRELFGLLVGPAKALALAHRRGIIHRDVKPGNLMFDDHNHMKLADFGLAHVADDPASLHLKDKAVGSLGWVAPEVALGGAGTVQSDIYGFGLCILYGLTGRQWLRANRRSELIALHQSPPPLDLESLPAVSREAAELLRRCLAVTPAERYASTDELVAALEQCAAPPRVVTALRIRKRTRAGYLLAGGIVGGLLSAVAVAYFFRSYFDELYGRLSGQPAATAPHARGPASQPAH